MKKQRKLKKVQAVSSPPPFSANLGGKASPDMTDRHTLVEKRQRKIVYSGYLGSVVLRS